MGCTPITRAAPTRSRSAAPAAAVPFLPAPRGRTRRGGLRRPAHGGHHTPRRGRPRAALDVAPPGRLGPRAVRAGVLPRDDPRGPAPPQAVVEEGQEASRPSRPGTAAGVHRAAPGLAGRRPTRPAPLGLRVYVDEAHIHQDADLGSGWGERGQRFFVASSSPGLSAKVSFYGLYLYNEGEVRLWPYPRANGCHTMDVLRRLRADAPDRKLIVLWDGASDHRAKAVREGACELGIDLVPLPGYSPDLMPVEALWRWLREDVTYHHCHASTEDLIRRVGAFEVRLNRDPSVIADRLWVKDRLDPG